jgi:flagellar biosynthesis/type III secretory pathway chaperone
MNTNTDRDLEEALDREIATASTLATTLAGERLALTGESPQAVVEQAAEKTQLFAMLERLEAERRALCDAAHVALPAMVRGLTPVIEGVSERVAERWRTLLELIGACRIANDVNGYIIRARLGQVSQLFQAIHGGASPIYGPGGKTFVASLREIAQA